jgi:glycine/D-amino acid oxidase-like deaminating enzyme/nitrite reductase/ring-hydroxylating ferredoxin subunit
VTSVSTGAATNRDTGLPGDPFGVPAGPPGYHVAMTSLWLDRPRDTCKDPLPADGRFQSVVVGAGLTGLTTAVLLARAGRDVGVVEARHVGAVTTGRTTAKASLLQGTKLQELLRLHASSKAQAYVEANQEGLRWLRHFCEEHDVAVQTRDAVVYAALPGERRAARKEHEACEQLGLDVRWHDSLDVPFPDHGGTVLADQIQFDPMDVLDALVQELRRHGGTLHEGQRVRSVSKSGRPELRLESGSTLTADDVVLATGMPILDRGLVFAMAEPKRSYLVAYNGADVDVPLGMYLSAGSSSRSYRDVPTEDGSTRFLVGGNGHTVGRTGSEHLKVENLRRWTEAHFPGSVETHAWSAQDYSPYDGLPLIGDLPRGNGRIYYGTGYDKWGMTNAVAAAQTISSQILRGDKPSWATRMERGLLPNPRAAVSAAEMNAKVGLAMTTGQVGVELRSVPDEVTEGQGKVGRDGVVPTGVSNVDGRICKVLALCTHLGGALKWNDAERSWDCPLHGSRFAPDGEVLEGPATRPLKRRDGGTPDGSSSDE